jgi:hypothetical protein
MSKDPPTPAPELPDEDDEDMSPILPAEEEPMIIPPMPQTSRSPQ